MPDRKSPLGPAQPRKVSTPKKTGPKAVKADAKGQFVRRRGGRNPTSNPDGLHSANPVVLSKTGDATQPVKNRQRRVPK